MSRTPVGNYAPVTGRRAWLAPRSGGARLHAGVDLAARAGTPVVAPEAGTVIVSKWNRSPTDTALAAPWNGYGPGVVVLRGASGVWHVLAHIVEPHGTGNVAEGERLGLVSGQAHVHWEVRTVHPWRPAQHGAVVEVSLDPLEWVRGQASTYADAGQPAPERPEDSYRTPRAHRPGATRPTVPPPARVGGKEPDGCS